MTARWMRWHRARLPELRFTFGWQAVRPGDWLVEYHFRQRLDSNGWTIRR